MTKTARTIARLALGTTAALGLTAGAALAEKWDMPLAYPATNYHSENAAKFAECVTAGTGGDVEIVTHPNGSLFKGNDIKRAVQTGQAPIGERLLSAHANENVLFGVDSIPFLATSFDDAGKLWKAAQPEVEKVLGEQNLHYVYSVPWPPQGLYFKKDVNSVADMTGTKFRAYNAATARIAELAGMVPVQVEAAELSQALATGVAESFISSGSTGYGSKVWEHLTNFSEVDAWLPRNTIFVNRDSWNGLSDANRKAVSDCGDKAAADGLAKARELTSFYLKGLSDNGMKVAPPSAGLKDELKAFGATMTDEWLASAGDAGRKIVDDYKAM